jgi:hypothetical protein
MYIVHQEEDTMMFKRWLPTFAAFPIGGWLAWGTVGSLDDPVSAAAGGLLAGAVIGAGQWLALRSYGISRRWVAYTAAAMAAGSAAAAATITGAGTELADVMLLGLVAGAAVGAAQSPLLGRGRRTAAAWTATTAASWSLGWLASAGVIDTADGFYVFGASGALLVTALTGLLVRRVLAAPAEPAGATRPAAALSV